MNRVRNMLMLVSMALATAAAAQNPSTKNIPIPQTGLRKAIDENNARWCEALRKGDAAGIGALYAEDGMEIATESGKVFRGPAQVRERWEKVFRDKVNIPLKASVTTLSVTQDGSTGVETGRFTYLSAPPHSVPVPVEGKYVVIWKQDKTGAWRVFVDMGLPG